MDIEVVFRGILGALEEAGIEYAVVGAFAVAIWGAPRATTDIDLLLTPAIRAVERDLVRHLPLRPVCLLGPLGFPLEGLARHALGMGSGAHPDAPPSSDALVATCDLGREGVETLRRLLETGGRSTVLVTGFLDMADWGMQRALCDLAVRPREGGWS